MALLMIAKAKEVMVRIEYQLRAPERTSIAECLRCGYPSPGGQLCSNCLCDDLGILINNIGAAKRWLNSIKIATQDAAIVIFYAHKNSRIKY